MSLVNVNIARESLLGFHLPEKMVDYDTRRFPAKRHDREDLLDRFVSLAAAFARALEAAGGDEELKQRAARFEELTAPGTSFDKARLTAYKAIGWAIKPFAGSRSSVKPRGKICLNGPSSRASGWELIAGEVHQIQRLVGDRDHVLGHLREALAYADRLVGLDPPGLEGDLLRRWRAEVFRLRQQGEAGRLLGCWLILRCRDALNEEQGNYDSFRQLIAFLSSDPPRLVTAVQDAAAILASEGGEATQQTNADESAESSAR
jgi:hypothetical protein